MIENLTNNNDSQNEGQPRRGFLSQLSWAVVPLLFVCSLALSGYMVFGSVITDEEAPLTEVQAGEPSEASPETTGEDALAEDEAETPAPEVVIGEWTAISGSEEEGRIENIRLAAEAIDGAVIEPGQTFSFNDAVGDVGTDERYQLAPVVSSDGMVYGRGGGSCQVSSALYLAALYTDLRIAERHPHSTVVDYVPIGLDATVVYGVMDLRIANDHEYPVTIHAEAEGQTVTVQIHGQPLEEGVTIAPVSTLIEYHVAGTPVPNALEWDPELENMTYYLVESYREYYYHGSKTETVLLARDRYEIFSDSTVRMPDGSVDTTK